MTNKVSQLGTILTVWAHPDDETWSAGGLLAQAASNGQRVICVTATRGEKGIFDEARWPADKLGEIREEELARALDVLGVKEHHWLGYIDGACDKVPGDEAAAKIQKIIERSDPDTIVTFGPLGSTGHSDHITVSGWTRRAIEKSRKKPALFFVADSKERYESTGHELDKKFSIYFNIDTPPLIHEKDMDLRLELSHGLLQKKLDALRVQVSQTDRLFSSPYAPELEQMTKFEGFVRADKYEGVLV